MNKNVDYNQYIVIILKFFDLFSILLLLFVIICLFGYLYISEFILILISYIFLCINGLNNRVIFVRLVGSSSL